MKIETALTNKTLPFAVKAAVVAMICLGLFAPSFSLANEARLEVIKLDSQVLKSNPLNDPVTRSVAIFLPAQATNGARLPIIYYLPGYGGSPAGPIKSSAVWLKYVQAIADQLRPTILVIVDGRTRWGGSQYLNSPAQGNYEDYVCDEIVGRVEAQYPVPATGIRRIIAGHSSGGFGALRLGMSHQNLFDRVIALSPDADFPVTQLPLAEMATVTNFALPEIERIERGVSRMPNGDLEYIFGLSAAYAPSGAAHPGQFDWIFNADGKIRQDVYQRWLDNDPTYIAQHNPHAFGENQLIYLDGAAQDEYKANIGARSVYDILRARKMHCAFDEPPGHHGDHLSQRLRHGLEWIYGAP
jgi:S-formylglutathione hydrolase FrmB